MASVKKLNRYKPAVTIISVVLGIIILFTLILVFSWPLLIKPTRAIPQANPQQNNALMQNLSVKGKAAILGMFQSGTGIGSIDLTASELNVLTLLALSQMQAPDFQPQGSLTEIQGNTIVTDTAIRWRGQVVGLHLVSQPAVENGSLALKLQAVKLGLLPIPPHLALAYIRSYLPPNLEIHDQPLRLVFNPNSLIPNVSIPLIKDPSLSLIGLKTSNKMLRATLKLSFRLGF